MNNDDILRLAPHDPPNQNGPHSKRTILLRQESDLPSDPGTLSHAERVNHPDPAVEPEPRPELGTERWAGSGPLPRYLSWDLLLIFLYLVAGLFGLALATKLGEKVSESYRPIGWVIAGVGVLVSLFGVYRRIRGGRIEITSFENGVVYSTGGRPKTVRWSEITAVTEKRVAMVIKRGESAGRRHLIRIVCKDGSDHRLEVGELGDSQRLAELIHEGTLPHLMPRVVEKLAGGRAVAFGQLVVAPHGLIHGRDTLLWDKMATIALTDGILTVKAKGAQEPWYAGDCGAIPNVQVLLNLIRSRFLPTDPGIARNQAATDSRYSVLDKYIGGAAGGRRFG